MTLDEILLAFPVGTRFVSRDDRARRTHVVEVHYAAPDLSAAQRQMTPGALNGDELVLVHDRLGYWPSLCERAPDLLGGLLDLQPAPVPSVEHVNAVLTAPAPTEAERGARWATMQAEIERNAETARLQEEAARTARRAQLEADQRRFREERTEAARAMRAATEAARITRAEARAEVARVNAAEPARWAPAPPPAGPSFQTSPYVDHASDQRNAGVILDAAFERGFDAGLKAAGASGRAPDSYNVLNRRLVALREVFSSSLQTISQIEESIENLKQKQAARLQTALLAEQARRAPDQPVAPLEQIPETASAADPDPPQADDLDTAPQERRLLV